MSVTARQLNRATLDRQMLLRREPLAVTDAVRRLVALQAQEAASPYLALWNRLDPYDPADLDAAFADHTIVKATLMRITLHAVHEEDYPAFHTAMVRALRASRLADNRYTTTGLSTADADEVLPRVVRFAARPRTRVEVEELLEDRLGEGRKRMWWALRTFAPLVHAPTGGPWSFGTRQAFVAALKPLPDKHRAGSLRRLVRRYLEGFGPATVPDIAQFTLLARSLVREALSGLGDDVVSLPGSGLYDVPGGVVPDEDMLAPPRLMPMWDSVLLAYADRSRVIPPDYRKLVIRSNGDVLPTLLVDGYVAGVWRPVDGGIEATAFHRLSEEAWSGLGAEATALTAFLAERDPTVYRRYGRWWATLPGAEVRVLPG